MPAELDARPRIGAACWVLVERRPTDVPPSHAPRQSDDREAPLPRHARRGLCSSPISGFGVRRVATPHEAVRWGASAHGLYRHLVELDRRAALARAGVHGVERL